MSNPSSAFKNTICDICGEDIPEGDDLFFHDHEKYCKSCAEEADIVCDCGDYKKPEFEYCFSCHNEN